MLELFEDKNKGGYFITAFGGEQLIARPKETYDGAMPSGNSVAAMVLQTLASLTGERSWQAAADMTEMYALDEIFRQANPEWMVEVRAEYVSAS